MNIAILPHHFPPRKGGIATWVFWLCKYLQHARIRVFVEKPCGQERLPEHREFETVGLPNSNRSVMMSVLQTCWATLAAGSNTKTRDETGAALNACIRTMHRKQIGQLVTVSAALTRHIQYEPIDAIICGRATPEGTIALFMKTVFNIPYLVLAHGMEILNFHHSRDERTLMTGILQCADLIIANSSYTKQSLLNTKLKGLNIEVVHPGVEADFFAKGDEGPKLHRKLGLNGDKIVLTVANLVPRKGQDVIIKAFPSILERVPNAKYVIVGAGKYENHLQSLVRELRLQEAVLMFGCVTDRDLRGYYQMCDVFAMPGRQVGVQVEGYGSAFLEASACAKPVIGGKSGGAKEAIVDGVTGLLVDGENPNEVAQAIVKLLRDEGLARKMGQHGRSWVKEELSWPVHTNKVQALLEQIVNSSDSR